MIERVKLVVGPHGHRLDCHNCEGDHLIRTETRRMECIDCGKTFRIPLSLSHTYTRDAFLISK